MEFRGLRPQGFRSAYEGKGTGDREQGAGEERERWEDGEIGNQGKEREISEVCWCGEIPKFPLLSSRFPIPDSLGALTVVELNSPRVAPLPTSDF